MNVQCRVKVEYIWETERIPVVLGQWGEMCKMKLDRKAGTGFRTLLKIVYFITFLRKMVIVFWGKRGKVGGLPAFVSPDIHALLLCSSFYSWTWLNHSLNIISIFVKAAFSRPSLLVLGDLTNEAYQLGRRNQSGMKRNSLGMVWHPDKYFLGNWVPIPCF